MLAYLGVSSSEANHNLLEKLIAAYTRKVPWESALHKSCTYSCTTLRYEPGFNFDRAAQCKRRLNQAAGQSDIAVVS